MLAISTYGNSAIRPALSGGGDVPQPIPTVSRNAFAYPSLRDLAAAVEGSLVAPAPRSAFALGRRLRQGAEAGSGTAETRYRRRAPALTPKGGDNRKRDERTGCPSGCGGVTHAALECENDMGVDSHFGLPLIHSVGSSHLRARRRLVPRGGLAVSDRFVAGVARWTDHRARAGQPTVCVRVRAVLECANDAGVRCALRPSGDAHPAERTTRPAATSCAGVSGRPVPHWRHRP